MTPEDRLLLTCTRQDFRQTQQQTVLDLCRYGPINWDVVYSTAQSHGVAPLVYANLRHCSIERLGIPQRVVAAFQGQVRHSIITKERVAEKITEALSFFKARSIEVMLIKGVALDVLVYDQPWYTRFNDVDLALKPCRDMISDQEQAEIGHFLHGSGIEYDYFEHHDVVINGALPLDFHTIWADAAIIRFRAHDVWVMSAEDMLISACINSCRKRFFRLKSLSDINEIINKYPDLDWTTLTQKARAYDCQHIVYTALLVTEMMLGRHLPEHVLDDLAVNPVRASLIRHLIRYLSQQKSLAESYPFSGTTIFGREVGSALLLPYLSYRRYQVARKLKEVYRAWKKGL